MSVPQVLWALVKELWQAVLQVFIVAATFVIVVWLILSIWMF